MLHTGDNQTNVQGRGNCTLACLEQGFVRDTAHVFFSDVTNHESVKCTQEGLAKKSAMRSQLHRIVRMRRSIGSQFTGRAPLRHALQTSDHW